MAINETIVKDKKFRVCTDPTKDEWDRVSFWTASTDVEMADGTDLETKMGSLVVQGGITDVQKSVWDAMSTEEKEAGNFCVINGDKYTLYLKNHEVSGESIVQVSQEQWDAMSPEQRKSGVFYIPGGSGVIDASAVAMDPSGTIFTGDNVEVALRTTSDELEKLNTNVETNTSNISTINDNLSAEITRAKAAEEGITNSLNTLCVNSLPRVNYDALPSKSTDMQTFFKEWIDYMISNGKFDPNKINIGMAMPYNYYGWVSGCIYNSTLKNNCSFDFHCGNTNDRYVFGYKYDAWFFKTLTMS